MESQRVRQDGVTNTFLSYLGKAECEYRCVCVLEREKKKFQNFFAQNHVTISSK